MAYPSQQLIANIIAKSQPIDKMIAKSQLKDKIIAWSQLLVIIIAKSQLSQNHCESRLRVKTIANSQIKSQNHGQVTTYEV